MNKSITILGVSITNETKSKVLEYLLDRIERPKEKTFIITPNPEMLVYASKHLDYQDKLNSADVALPDGIGLSIAARVLGRKLSERITGTDFIEELCKVSREKPLSIGFLGGRGGVAELTAKRLRQKYPWIDITFVAEEWNDKVFRMKYLVSSIDKKKKNILNTKYEIPDTDILFVAFGVPKQEEWIYDNLPHLPIKAAIGVGGAFDFLSGKVRRAPVWMRKLGLEWLFRLIIQPWRWKRQLALLTFLRLVLQQKFSH